MRADLALSLVVLLTLSGCQEYGLKNKVEEDPPPEDSGTPPIDTHTGDTAPVDSDTDTGEVVVEDSPPPEDTAVVATESVYINTSDMLYSYDPATNTSARIGAFRSGGNAVTDMTDIAIDLSGHMYGVSFSKLYSINPATAEASFVASVADSLTGLTFVSDGRLVGTGSKVSFVDTSSGALTTLVPAGRYTTSGDIIGLPDGMLYWTVEGGDDLVQIDPASGGTVRVGNIGVSGLYGLGYADGKMLGFTSGGRVVTIDESTARSGTASSLSGSWWGATTNPVLW
ncbi:MAG: hypothetical protein EXR69_00995 [Myxococcales bacterium]|nr:hypothetical protein [Myxococcales bacterium]